MQIYNELAPSVQELECKSDTDLPVTETRASELVGLGLLDGCYPTEYAPEGTFVWTRGQFRFRPPCRAKFMVLSLGYLGPQGTIRLFQDGVLAGLSDLREGWQGCALRLPAGIGWLTLEIDPIPNVESDQRELGVMIRTISLFDEEQDFIRLRERFRNTVLNDSEFRQGLPILTSYPPNLRITTEVRCNIPETSQACAYCTWDWAKELEKGSPAFGLETLDQLGSFYTNAQALNDCSIGEPVMNKQFGQIVSRFVDDDKHYSFTTNGQLMVERRRRDLLGRKIDVYFSLDAATPEGFKRYRNDRFDTIISNLRALCREKREHQNLPKVTASFIAMRSNAGEVEAYLELMKDVGVDQVKFRALNLDDNVAPVVVNNGYRFDYHDETLSMSELREVGDKARRIAADLGLALHVDWDQFESDVKQDQPLCAEPWKTLYVLARGIMPCSFASEPLAKWKDQGARSLDRFLEDTFNSPAYQELRSELAAGRLAAYCRNTPSCPVLKRMTAGNIDSSCCASPK